MYFRLWRHCIALYTIIFNMKCSHIPFLKNNPERTLDTFYNLQNSATNSLRKGQKECVGWMCALESSVHFSSE